RVRGLLRSRGVSSGLPGRVLPAGSEPPGDRGRAHRARNQAPPRRRAAQVARCGERLPLALPEVVGRLVAARPLALALACLVLAGCAAPQPMFLGGRTTPRDRADLGVGGAARIPLADLQPPERPADGEQLLHHAESGGVAPVAW